ncbi:hypothetical protein [Halobaculum litoreum]|uniref:Transposase, Mutator family n=1 Tax=Halobaculum litoreum TaxID=3031998 RepID=A0ABD5XKA1_9EURY|nr:hypothetical protein [Halobaculum sp. DT92]
MTTDEIRSDLENFVDDLYRRLNSRELQEVLDGDIRRELTGDDLGLMTLNLLDIRPNDGWSGT